jgi:hypothetical protein
VIGRRFWEPSLSVRWLAPSPGTPACVRGLILPEASPASASKVAATLGRGKGTGGACEGLGAGGGSACKGRLAPHLADSAPAAFLGKCFRHRKAVPSFGCSFGRASCASRIFAPWPAALNEFPLPATVAIRRANLARFHVRHRGPPVRPAAARPEFAGPFALGRPAAPSPRGSPVRGLRRHQDCGARE